MIKIDILKSIAYVRREYKSASLRRKDLPEDPLVLFEIWLNQACEARIPESTAMTLATVDDKAQPYQRSVLLKDYDSRGMVFYTNLKSRKALQIEKNARVSLHFSWSLLERQIMVLGEVSKLSTFEVLKYFQIRPRDTQISTWASKQSSPISMRKILECKFLEFKEKFKDEKVPLPNFWGGYRVKYNTLEFWQGGTNRLHDRFIYKYDGFVWKIDRLSP